MSFIKSEEAKKYLKCFKSCPPIDLGEEMYPAVESRGIELLTKMLEFNPNKRISAEEALQDEYFDDIRLEDQEEFSPIEIDLTFIDKYQEGELSQDQLREIITTIVTDKSQNYEQKVIDFCNKINEESDE